jgi:hypothetical protein
MQWFRLHSVVNKYTNEESVETRFPIFGEEETRECFDVVLGYSDL